MNLKRFNKILNIGISIAVVSLCGVLVYYYLKL